MLALDFTLAHPRPDRSIVADDAAAALADLTRSETTTATPPDQPPSTATSAAREARTAPVRYDRATESHLGVVNDPAAIKARRDSAPAFSRSTNDALDQAHRNPTRTAAGDGQANSTLPRHTHSQGRPRHL